MSVTTAYIAPNGEIMSVTTAYIAGPMRGYPQFNFPAFDECAAWLREWGYAVTSPAEHDRDGGMDETNYPTGTEPLDGFDLAAALLWDLEQVATADILVLLPGWEQSSGTTAELALARALGKDVYTYEPDAEDGTARRLYWLPHRPADHAVPLSAADKPAAESVCAEADRLVSGERQTSYGHPYEDFTRTGRLWGAILGTMDIPPALVGLCMAAVKISREVNRPKRDNLVDLAGYAKTVELVREREAE